jgi:hypothetical protein
MLGGMSERDRGLWLSSSVWVGSFVVALTLEMAVTEEVSGHADVAVLPFEHHTKLEQLYPEATKTLQYDPEHCDKNQKPIGLKVGEVLVVNEGEIVTDPKSGQTHFRADQDTDPDTGNSYPMRMVIQRTGVQKFEKIEGLTHREYSDSLFGLARYDPMYDDQLDPADMPVDITLKPGDKLNIDQHEPKGALVLNLTTLNGLHFVVNCGLRPHALDGD